MSQGDLMRLLRRVTTNSEKDSVAEALEATLRLIEEAMQELIQERQDIAQQLRRVIFHQRQLDNRLIAIEHNRLFQIIRYLTHLLRSLTNRLPSVISPETFDAAARSFNDKYREWRAAQDLAASLEAHRPRVTSLCHQPKISIILPICAPRANWLQATVESVLRQSYSRWQLCVGVPPQQKAAVDYVHAAARSDPRIRLFDYAGPEDLNSARAFVEGEYVAVLGQHDLLSPSALYDCVKAIEDSNYDVLYSDEDSVDSYGCRRQPLFKPDWSPELLFSCMYVGRLLLISKRMLDRIEWFRGEFGPMQEYDAVLRLMNMGVRAGHIPRILYHRRQGELGGHEIGRRVLTDAIARCGWQAEVELGPMPGTYRLRRRVSGKPFVSIVTCSCQPRRLRRFVRLLRKRTDYASLEIVIVQHKTSDACGMESVLREWHCVRVPYEGPFNFALMNNMGASLAQGEVLVFMNDDVEPLSGDWLACMVAQAQRGDVGAVGAKLVYPSGAIQHAGVVIGIMDGAGHPGRHLRSASHWRWLHLTRNVSAVTGACLAVRRGVFQQLGGFDYSFPENYNDVDFCLRAREAGYQVIYEAAAVLRHYEAQSRVAVVRYDERENFHKRWGGFIGAGDPFYNPNLTRDREDLSLRLVDFSELVSSAEPPRGAMTSPHSYP